MEFYKYFFLETPAFIFVLVGVLNIEGIQTEWCSFLQRRIQSVSSNNVTAIKKIGLCHWKAEPVSYKPGHIPRFSHSCYLY